jgi:hypothetical protein
VNVLQVSCYFLEKKAKVYCYVAFPNFFIIVIVVRKNYKPCIKNIIVIFLNFFIELLFNFLI